MDVEDSASQERVWLIRVTKYAATFDGGAFDSLESVSYKSVHAIAANRLSDTHGS